MMGASNLLGVKIHITTVIFRLGWNWLPEMRIAGKDDIRAFSGGRWRLRQIQALPRNFWFGQSFYEPYAKCAGGRAGRWVRTRPAKGV